MNATATKTEKKGLKTYTFDPAKYMKSRVAMQEYLNVSLEEDVDIKMLISSFEDLIRTWALSKLARKTKIKQIDLCEILLGDVEPTPEVLTKIAEALGLKIPNHFDKNRKTLKKDWKVEIYLFEKCIGKDPNISDYPYMYDASLCPPLHSFQHI